MKTKAELLTPHRQKIAAELFAWADFFSEKARVEWDPYRADILRDCGRTLRGKAQEKLRAQELDFDQSYAWPPLEDVVVNPPLAVIQLIEGEIGAHVRYGMPEVAAFLNQLVPEQYGEDSMRRRALENTRFNLHARVRYHERVKQDFGD